ncbi:tetratricopeptide repeat protein [Lysobacter yangpyeongensis]|uniref:Tetratricopeptide repeat protein n=1 Tax=Lysobacter yangpyeongensis TaxID=346182 RepID=A0ABW0SNI5_9GAMM
MSKQRVWQWSVLALVLGIMPVLDVRAEQAVVPPDPLEDPLLITAGFLGHHQDLKYRLLGMKAYEAKDFDKAMRYFRRASYFADKPSQGMVGEMYWNGEGVAADRALAYAWMDLAAERGYTGFIGLREKYWKSLDAAERARAIEEGQAIYARFGDAAAKPRYETALRRGRKEMTGSRTGFNHGVKIELPGPSGSQMIEGSKFYDERYWDARKYWAWQDKIWARPRIGKVTVGELEVATDAVDTRIPETAPEIDAPAPEVPPEVPPEPAPTP